MKGDCLDGWCRIEYLDGSWRRLNEVLVKRRRLRNIIVKRSCSSDIGIYTGLFG
jgi:hypothetical protein